MYLRYGRVCLKPLLEIDKRDWQRIHTHFRDPEIAHLNGTAPNRMPLWLLRRVLKADSRRADRRTYGIYDEADSYIGTIELYDIRFDNATLGIIIGEKSHWSKGYGPEAMQALLDYAFHDMRLNRIVLHTYADNPRAQAAFRKVGFRELRRVQSGNRGRIDVVMELDRPTWLERSRNPSVNGSLPSGQ
jgi:RimJ/RimL family protein N-acetyltransferase